MIGPVKVEVNDMVQWVLKYSGNFFSSITLRSFNVEDIHSPINIKKRYTFDALIESRWVTEITPPNTNEPEDKE